MSTENTRISASRKAVMAALLCGAASAIASAAIADSSGPTAPLRLRSDYLGYGVSLSPRMTYSDNIELAPAGLEEGAFLVSNLLSGAAIIASPRFTGVIGGDLDFSYFVDDGDLVVNQSIGAATTTTILDDWFYVDIAGETSRQLVGDNARFSSNANAARSQRANVHTYSASPYLYRDLSDRQALELRYRFSQTFIDDGNSAANPFAGGLLNDSTSHEAVANYDSGARFGRIAFTTTAYANMTVEDGSSALSRLEYDQASASLAARYAITDRFALSGAIGYDEIDTEAVDEFFDDSDLSGFNWRAGFTATPGRKSSLRLEYGRRYGDEFIDASVRYDISRRVVFSATAGRTFETRTQSAAAQFRGQQRLVLDFADRLREGEALSPSAVLQTANRLAFDGLNSQSIGFGVVNNANARLAGAWDRLEISSSATYQDSDYGFRSIKNYGGDIDVRRQVSRLLTGYASVYYRHSDTAIDLATCIASPFLFGFDVDDPLFDPVAVCTAFADNNGATDTVGGRIGASYRLRKNLSVFGEFNRATRWADNAILEYDENAVTAGLTLDF